MLRDPEGRLQCPFGADWEKQSAGHDRLDSVHRTQFWLALMEMHDDGCLYGTHSDRDMPYVLERVMDRLRQRKLAWQQALRSASEHLVGIPEDLKKA